MRPAEPFALEFSVESYLDRLAERFVNMFDANCYLYLSRAMDRFDLAEHGDGIAELALDRCALERALVIGVESDMLFTIGEQYAVAEALRSAGTRTRFASLRCPQGHDSFLVEIEHFGSEIREFLELL
jgi:homoserine O-acetyltransferase